MLPNSIWFFSKGKTSILTIFGGLILSAYAGTVVHAEPSPPEGLPPVNISTLIPEPPGVQPDQQNKIETGFTESSLLPSTVSSLPGVSGLLPLPLVKPEETSYDSGETDPTAEDYDEAVVLYGNIQKHQALAQAAADQLPAARREYLDAKSAHQNAQQAVIIAEQKAQEAEKTMNIMVRNTYMNSQTSVLTTFIFSDSPESAANVLRLVPEMQTASENLLADTIRAREELQQAKNEAVNQLQRLNNAEAATQELERQVTFHTAEARKASDALQTYLLQYDGGQVEIGVDGCPVEVPEGTLRMGAEEIGVADLCRRSVLQAATPQAALAVKWAFSKLGAPYACKGIGRMAPWRFDCSSLVSRAYWETTGIPIASATYAHSTRNMMPWDGVSLHPRYQEVAVEEIAPGDLLLTRSCTTPPCLYQHVTMAIADGYILHTNRCGDVAHITRNPGYGPEANFVVARRVILFDGEQLAPEILELHSNSIQTIGQEMEEFLTEIDTELLP